MEPLPFPHRFCRTLALLFCALLAGCRDSGGTARDAADAMARMFFDQRISEAYEATAPAFRFRRSKNYFEARVRDLGLCEARKAKWSEPERHGGFATVRGIFELKDGGKLPLVCTFTMEDGAWRLLEARSEPAPGEGKSEDVFAVTARTRDTVGTRALEILEPSAQTIPAEPQLQQLAEDTLLLFNDAIQNDGDFSALYAAASNRWKYRGRDLDPARAAKPDPFNDDNRLTVAALHNAFASAVAAKVDLSPIRGKKMTLTEPARVTSDGVLTMKGTFDATVYQASIPDSPRKMDFSLEYVNETGKWKLFGITVHILAMEKTPPGTPVAAP